MNYSLHPINVGIRKLFANKELVKHINFKCFNGALIPFVGPEWKDVNFSSKSGYLTVVPAIHKSNIYKKNLVGFCEDPNFDMYPQIRIDGIDWINIKEKLLEALVYSTTAMEPGSKDVMPYFWNLNEMIQSYGKGLVIEYDDEDKFYYIVEG